MNAKLFNKGEIRKNPEVLRVYECSHCGTEFMTDLASVRYCPNCRRSGLKMRFFSNVLLEQTVGKDS